MRCITGMSRCVPPRSGEKPFLCATKPTIWASPMPTLTVNGPLLAQFLEEMIAEEDLLLQQQRDHEAQSIREAIVGKSNGSSAEQRELETERPAVVVDLTRIPHYEEYR